MYKCHRKREMGGRFRVWIELINLPSHMKNLDSPTLISPWLGVICTSSETRDRETQTHKNSNFRHCMKHSWWMPQSYIFVQNLQVMKNQHFKYQSSRLKWRLYIKVTLVKYACDHKQTTVARRSSGLHVDGYRLRLSDTRDEPADRPVIAICQYSL